MTKRVMTSENAEIVIRFDAGDPVFRFLTRIVHRHPTPYSFLFCVLLLVPVYLAAAAEGVLSQPGLSPDLLSDVGMYLMFFLMNPFLLAISLIYHERFRRTVTVLAENGVMHPEDPGLRRTTRKWNTILNHRWATAALYAITLAICVVVDLTYTFSRLNNWHWPDGFSRPTLASLLLWPSLFLAYYLILQVIFRVVASFLYLRELFQETSVTVQPLHPDKCGGLGPIGNLSLFLNVIVLAIGLAIAGGLYSNIYVMNIGVLSPLNVLMVVTYLMMSAFIVFTPIWVAHRKMQIEQQIMLSRLNEKFEEINGDLRALIASEEKVNVPSLAEKTESLNTIRDLYSIVAQHPVWPFNSKVMYSFAGSVLWPLGFFVVQIYIQKFLE